MTVVLEVTKECALLYSVMPGYPLQEMMRQLSAPMQELHWEQDPVWSQMTGGSTTGTAGNS